MSKQDAAAFAQFQLKKCVIAAAITVLKCKPNNVNTQDYCEIIKKKILDGKQSPLIDITFGDDCDNALSNIFNEQNVISYSQPEVTPLFSEFVLASCSESIPKENSSVVNFSILKAINNARDSIYRLNGTFSSYEDTYLACELEKIKNSESTQESGYYSEQKSLFYKIGKNIDYTSLNKSVIILIQFLTSSFQKDQRRRSVNKYVSELIGKLIDILHQNNVTISSFEKVLEAIEKILNELFCSGNSFNSKIDSQQIISKFFLLNESYLTIRYSIKSLMKRVENLLTEMSCGDSNVEIELSDPNFINRSYFLFFLTEHLLKKYVVCKTQFKTTEKENLMGECSSLFDNKKKLHTENLNEQCSSENDNFESIFTDVLNRVALEHVETYPLIAFWAIDCLNSATDNSC